MRKVGASRYAREAGSIDARSVSVDAVDDVMYHFDGPNCQISGPLILTKERGWNASP